MMFLRGILTFLLGTFAVTSAVKDDEYYRAGMGNRNVDLPLYWADAHNVLEDLDQFSYLYIEYHNCAWAQNRAQYGEEESGSGSADENDYWYMGATQDYAANVAFSLYGSLTGDKFSGCNEDTFINSFTTNQGFEVFAAAIYYAGSTATDYSQSYTSECQGGSGVVCDYTLGFGYASFSTDTCDPSYVTSVTDSMGYMNNAFQGAQCVQIYDASTASYDNYNNRKLQEQERKDSKNKDNKVEDSDKDRNLQDNYGYGYGYGDEYGYNSYQNNYYNYAGTALSILYYSNACFIQNFWSPNGGCPDPHGKLQEYQQNFNKGVRMSMKVDTFATYRKNMAVGTKYVSIGFVLFLTALIMFLSEQLMAFRAKKRSLRGSMSSSPSKTRKKSVVELVNTTGTKIKKSANRGVKKAVAKVTKKKSKSKDKGKDGVMVEASSEVHL